MRILIWHISDTPGRIGPTYYMEANYTPIALRIHAEKAPDVEDAEFDIFDDGVTLFTDRGTTVRDTLDRITSTEVSTTVLLPIGENLEELAEDFHWGLIETGSLVHCEMKKPGGGNNFTVSLELQESSEE